MIRPLIISTLIVLSSCAQSTKSDKPEQIDNLIQAQDLDQDSCALNSLTNSEISAYQALLAFAESQIDCDSYGEDKELCWKRFLESDSFDRTTGAIRLPWTLNSQNAFIGKMNFPEVTDSIWIKSWSYTPATGDTSDYYYINFNGSLRKLYSAAAAKDEDWKANWKHIQYLGEISPSLLAGIFNPEINTLLYDPKMRLLMTLELMRMNKY